MKKFVILVLVMTSSLAIAQRPNEGRHHRHGPQKGPMAELMQEFTAEQIAQLETKKLTLVLDLNQSQQSQMLALQTEIAADKKAKHAERKALKESYEIKKPTSEEVFAKMDEALSKKIEVKQKVKQILNNDQYERWQQMHHQKKKARKAHRGKRR